LGHHHSDARLAAAATAMRAAVESVLTRPASRTPDLGGTATTEEMGAAIIAALHGADFPAL
jgi:tartrate dehydrogenase/decarboxylase/D-malate dehydrogenase